MINNKNDDYILVMGKGSVIRGGYDKNYKCRLAKRNQPLYNFYKVISIAIIYRSCNKR